MFKIIKSEEIAQNVYLMVVEAPRIAKSCRPGQFVIVKNGEEGERIPLTICDYDAQKGTVTIIFQVVGASTNKMARLKAGDYYTDFVGPLGQASEYVKLPIEEQKKIRFLFVAGGIGAAPVLPQVIYLSKLGIKCDVILGARTKELLILEDRFKDIAGNLYICTDDGSYGIKGRVTDVIKQLIEDQHKEYDECVAIGPMIMMKFVCLQTKQYNLKTTVSLNPVMVDGTGMCGACRVSVDGKIKFACVDGPEFDGFLINFDEAIKRQAMYKDEEGKALLKLREGATHHGGCGQCD